MNVVYFEFNNWMAGYGYPNEEPFLTWFKNDFDLCFLNDEWVENNKLCVLVSYVDMSVNFCVTAKRSWVKKNCPQLLDKYSSFLRKHEKGDEDGAVYGQFLHRFLPYDDYSIGISFATEKDEEIFYGSDEEDEYEDEDDL